MEKESNLFWQKVLWSVVIIFAVTLFAYIRYNQVSNIISFGIYIYLVWPYVIIPSIILVLVRLPAIGLSAQSFVYLFAGTANACLGITGVYALATSDTRMSLLIHAMFVSNIILATFIFFDGIKHK